MPEISRFYGIVIKMYFADHAHRIFTLSTQSTKRELLSTAWQ